MECKFASANPLTSLVIELIDTLWNVNSNTVIPSKNV